MLPYLQARYPGQVIGIRQRDNWRLSGPGIEECNAEDRATLERLFEKYQFAAVLDCAGNCALKSCELDPAMAWRINVEGVRNLLEICVKRQVRFVHLSIDLVFSGTGSGGHVETDPTDPVTVYGKTMVAAEEMILAGEPSGVHFANFAADGDQFQRPCRGDRLDSIAIQKMETGDAVFRRNPTPTYTDCLNELCEAVLGSDLAGLYHAGGPRRLSLYNIAQIINRVGGYDPKLLIGCPRIDGWTDSAAGGRCFDEFQQAFRARWDLSRLIRGRWRRNLCRRMRSGTLSAADLPDRRNCWRRCCTGILGRLPGSIPPIRIAVRWRLALEVQDALWPAMF